jgi:hypothetical protein
MSENDHSGIMDALVDMQAVKEDPATDMLYLEWNELRAKYGGKLPPRRMSVDDAMRLALEQSTGSIDDD